MNSPDLQILVPSNIAMTDRKHLQGLSLKIVKGQCFFSGIQKLSLLVKVFDVLFLCAFLRFFKLYAKLFSLEEKIDAIGMRSIKKISWYI